MTCAARGESKKYAESNDKRFSRMLFEANVDEAKSDPDLAAERTTKKSGKHSDIASKLAGDTIVHDRTYFTLLQKVTAIVQLSCAYCDLDSCVHFKRESHKRSERQCKQKKRRKVYAYAHAHTHTLTHTHITHTQYNLYTYKHNHYIHYQLSLSPRSGHTYRRKTRTRSPTNTMS
jgi:hypothetical protein